MSFVSSCSVLWSTYMTASGTAERSTSSASNWSAHIAPVASSIRIWSTESSSSPPPATSPPARWEWISFSVMVRGASSGIVPRRMADLADESRRLSLASALTRHVRDQAGDPPPDADVAALLVAGRSLARGVEDFEERHHVRFDPGYPGVVAGPEAGGPRARVLFACTASRADGRAVGTVFTMLIAGRRPSVSVGPPGTRAH
jgi:hypothetical protein